MTDFRALCSELFEIVEDEYSGTSCLMELRSRARAALAQLEPQGPKLIYRYSPATIAECGGPCEQGPQYCDCGQIKGEPEPQGPGPDDVTQLYYKHGGGDGMYGGMGEVNFEEAVEEALARWGRSAIELEGKCND